VLKEKKNFSRPPLWLMRQAGRYLPEYRQLRAEHSTLKMFKTPQIATEITLQPLKRFELDAAILYADILLIPDALGLGLFFQEGEGPCFTKYILQPEDVDALKERIENKEKFVESLSYVGETVARIKEKLSPEQALIGFAGAPLTVATYMLEGKLSKGQFPQTHKFIHHHLDEFHKLLSILTDATIYYLEMQINAGAQMIQLFESWSHAVSPSDYFRHCYPYSQKIFQFLKQRKIPAISFFGYGAGLIPDLLSENQENCFDAIGVDWHQDLKNVSQLLKDAPIALQGNLNPYLLNAPIHNLEEALYKNLQIGSNHKHGFIFNLGHGCRPDAKI
jgi:uroporphyrinogen decarboxylase